MGIIDYEKDLTPVQLEAVFSSDGPTLVIAGAGSGKTRTLVYRVARLVEKGIPPEKILLLTFTRKASQEMLQRVEHMLGRSCREVAGGTFHSLAYKLLRLYGAAIGLRSPLTVMDRKDSEEIVAKIIKKKGWEKNKDRPDKKEFIELLSRIVNRDQSFEQGLAQNLFEDGTVLSQLKEIYNEYEAVKKGHGLLDYDDLLIHCLRLFREEKGIAQKIAAFYHYVLVDEYQDTNLLQAEIVRHLARDNIMVVGDDSQSIYGFRGAHFKNIMDFPSHFPGTRVIKLEENFRSSQPILTLANKVISFSRERYSKCLFSRSKIGVAPCCIEVPYEEAQSQFVVQQIQEFHNQGIGWEEMAVLFRAGHHSFNLEVFLQKQGIPFKKYGGRRFVEGAHIKDFLSFLKAAHNPKDLLAWERILKLLDGLGPKRAEEIVQRMTVCPDWASRLECLSLFPRLKSQLQGFKTLFQALADESEQTPTQALEMIWEYYKNLLPTLYEDSQRRQKEIEEIIRISYNYTETEVLLGDLSLEVYEETDDREKDRLVLSTVHSAKGLEWKVVFIIWLTEGRFPSTHALMDTEEMEEERRLLYVAITRAKDRLFLTYPLTLSQRDGFWQKNDPCHFVASIPEEILSRRGRPERKEPVPVFSPPKEDDGGFSKGVKVFHPLFGNGIIQEPPQERKVRVHFKRYGSKVLHLDYARLEKGEV